MFRRIDYTGVSASESTPQLVPGTTERRHAIEATYLAHTSGDGTQWRVRYYRGYTASKRAEYIGSVDLPSVAGTWYDADGDEDHQVAAPPLIVDLTYPGFPGGWTDADTPKTGLGLYCSVDQLANGGATDDALTIGTEIGRP